MIKKKKSMDNQILASGSPVNVNLKILRNLSTDDACFIFFFINAMTVTHFKRPEMFWDLLNCPYKYVNKDTPSGKTLCRRWLILMILIVQNEDPCVVKAFV